MSEPRTETPSFRPHNGVSGGIHSFTHRTHAGAQPEGERPRFLQRPRADHVERPEANGDDAGEHHLLRVEDLDDAGPADQRRALPQLRDHDHPAGGQGVVVDREAEQQLVEAAGEREVRGSDAARLRVSRVDPEIIP